VVNGRSCNLFDGVTSARGTGRNRLNRTGSLSVSGRGKSGLHRAGSPAERRDTVGKTPAVRKVPQKEDRLTVARWSGKGERVR